LKRGLRASLQSASLITGQQVVTLDFVHDAPATPVTLEGSDFVLPAIEGGGLSGLTASATALLDKVNSIPFKQIGDNLDDILQVANNVANGQPLQEAFTDLSATLGLAKTFVARLNSGASPALRQLPAIATELEKALTSANRLMLSFDSGYGDNTEFNRELDRLLVQLNDAVRSIRALADLLARHPEALIKGRPGQGIE
jgi:paraquat-inducible protein B